MPSHNKLVSKIICGGNYDRIKRVSEKTGEYRTGLSVVLWGVLLRTETESYGKNEGLGIHGDSGGQYLEELLAKIEERKEDTFKLTFEDQGFLYICVGYGTQQTGGYSIAVNDLYETANAVYIDTNLIGPSPEEKSKPVASYPYVVVKTEFSQKPMVFD